MSPWRADDYASTKPTPVYEVECQSKPALTNTMNDGLGGFVMSRLITRAYALREGALFVYTPLKPSGHLLGAEGRVDDPTTEAAHEETLAKMESFLNLGADEVDLRTIQGNMQLVYKSLKHKPQCGRIVMCHNSFQYKLSSDQVELSMPEIRERYRRHRVYPELPWTPGAVYAVAVHWRRGDIAPDSVAALPKTINPSYRRGVVSEDQYIVAMEMMKLAILNAGENQGQEIVFHLFTEGNADCCVKLGLRNDTVLHIAAATSRLSTHAPANADEELRLAFHSFVMADALLVGNSHLSVAASWLSKGWIWAFPHPNGRSLLPPKANEFNIPPSKRKGHTNGRVFNDQGEVSLGSIKPPRFVRATYASDG